MKGESWVRVKGLRYAHNLEKDPASVSLSLSLSEEDMNDIESSNRYSTTWKWWNAK